jgi:hypothetical protein
MTNTLMDRIGSLANTELLAMTYVCFVLNHTYIGPFVQYLLQLLHVPPLISALFCSSPGGSQSTTR